MESNAPLTVETVWGVNERECRKRESVIAGDTVTSDDRIITTNGEDKGSNVSLKSIASAVVETVWRFNGKESFEREIVGDGDTVTSDDSIARTDDDGRIRDVSFKSNVPLAVGSVWEVNAKEVVERESIIDEDIITSDDRIIKADDEDRRRDVSLKSSAPLDVESAWGVDGKELVARKSVIVGDTVTSDDRNFGPDDEDKRRKVWLDANAPLPVERVWGVPVKELVECESTTVALLVVVNVCELLTKVSFGSVSAIEGDMVICGDCSNRSDDEYRDRTNSMDSDDPLAVKVSPKLWLERESVIGGDALTCDERRADDEDNGCDVLVEDNDWPSVEIVTEINAKEPLEGLSVIDDEATLTSDCSIPVDESEENLSVLRAATLRWLDVFIVVKSEEISVLVENNLPVWTDSELTEIDLDKGEDIEGETTLSLKLLIDKDMWPTESLLVLWRKNDDLIVSWLLDGLPSEDDCEMLWVRVCGIMVKVISIEDAEDEGRYTVKGLTITSYLTASANVTLSLEIPWITV